ncbi:MAG TPA: DinB family protein [Bryobacteraceae bacterium]|nr:DinB family protein [Bryobacteraceae bacterium]
MPFSQSLLPEFDAEMKNTRKILECVPDGKFDYRPHPKSMTMGRLATHVAELATWVGPTLDQDVLDIPPDYKPHLATSRAELLEIFDKAVADARPRIEATSDEKWQQIWSLKFGGNTILSMPRAAVIRTVIMNHLIHHRAQLGVFLRLNDVAIPGMYGPSADESMTAAAV